MNKSDKILTKYYHNGKIKKKMDEGESRGMLTNEDYQRAKAFLDIAKPMIKSGECTFKMSAKNKALQRKYGLKDSDCKKIIDSLQPKDLAEIDESRKSDERSEAFVFFKIEGLYYYGEPIDVKLYLKLCIEYTKLGDEVIVWSIHEEGMHND